MMKRVAVAIAWTWHDDEAEKLDMARLKERVGHVSLVTTTHDESCRDTPCMRSLSRVCDECKEPPTLVLLCKTIKMQSKNTIK